MHNIIYYFFRGRCEPTCVDSVVVPYNKEHFQKNEYCVVSFNIIMNLPIIKFKGKTFHLGHLVRLC